MAVLNQLRLPNGKMVRVEEWCELPTHSSNDVPVNAGAAGNPQEIYYFNYGEGDPYPGAAGARTASKIDTNLDKGAQLLSGEMFVFAHTFEPIESVDIAAAPPLPADIAEFNTMQFKEICAKSWMEFKVASKVFWEGRIPWTPAGSGIHGYDNLFGSRAINNGVPAPSSMRRFTIPTHIAASNEVLRGLQRFLNGGLTGNGTAGGGVYVQWKFFWKLEGLKRRQVV